MIYTFNTAPSFLDTELQHYFKMEPIPGRFLVTAVTNFWKSAKMASTPARKMVVMKLKRRMLTNVVTKVVMQVKREMWTKVKET